MDEALNPLTRTEARGGIVSFAPGKIIANRYELRRMLGRGGMGEVWLAFDVRLRVETALKALHPDAFSETRAAELLHREIRAARGVVSPHVCRIFDLVVADGLELLSMEYVDGMTLREILNARSPLELREAKEIASQFLAGLSAIHAAGLVHRDLKPANLMVTRAGRAVVMDLGLAREVSLGSGSVAGTPAYMAPEQARGEKLDARADLFAAGVVLAEMIAPAGVREFDSREKVWRSLRHVPPQVEDSAWASVIRRALEPDPERRYESAQALARALEQVSLRHERPDEASPYPGLAFFRETDAHKFFGREAEIEALWRKLAGAPRLLALAGPSGAGKSSLVRAGIVPAKPEGWRAALCTPGDRPFASLARALAPDLARDANAVADLIVFDKPEVALALCASWRRRHAGALVIVDQFEELFTLAPPEVRGSFAELLGRLPIEADVHVLLSMRDDFLLRCQDHPALAPLFSDLTPCAAPRGDALRRAIAQPALTSGYRFEDDAMIDRILGEVGEERAALPLVAFTMASLWERRHRDEGMLTRAAYEEIGGVSGSLAHHAEAVLQRIGADGEAIVRELFRNLVTAQGTRAARDREELLSVFEPDRRPRVAAVLDALVSARLLTAYDEESIVTAGGAERRRVEIVHESLLTHWPRLVRWRTQDADGAQFRDHLRQSAQVWEERGRPDDLLWSGNVYRELALWRSRYAGALSANEASFARAVEARAQQRKRSRQLAFAAILLAVLGVAVTTSVLWRRAERERARATAQSRRAEAQKLFAMARLEMTKYPTGALAYATKSLELDDTQTTRSLIVEILWRGPIARMLELTPDGFPRVDVTPDGRQVLFASNLGDDFFVPVDGGPPTKFRLPDDRNARTWISNDGRFLMEGGDPVRVFSLPDVRLVQELDPASLLSGDGSRFFTLAPSSERGVMELGARSLGGGEPVHLGRFHFDPREAGGPDRRLSPHPSGTWVAVLSGNEIRREPVGPKAGSPAILWRSDRELEDINFASFGPWGDHLFGAAAGGFEVWSARTGRTRWLPIPAGEAEGVGVAPADVVDDAVVACSGDWRAWLWDLNDPVGTRALRIEDGDIVMDAAIEPQRRWIATASKRALSLWPVQRYVRVIRKPKTDWSVGVRFLPDGRGFLTCDQPENGARLWWLDSAREPRDLRPPGAICTGVAVDPAGRNAIVSAFRGGPFLHDLTTGEARRLLDAKSFTADPAFDQAGKKVALFAGGKPGMAAVRVIDVASGETISIPVKGKKEDRVGWQVRDLLFGVDGQLYSGGLGGFKRWNVPGRRGDVIMGRRGDFALVSGSRDGRFVLVALGKGIERGVESGDLWLFDLIAGTRRRITTHGAAFSSVAIDAAGKIIATTAPDGTIRVGKATGEEPHLLMGEHSDEMRIAISPDGRWIVTESFQEVRIWPAPDLTKPPLHTLPHDQLLARLRELTNLRAIPNPAAEAGYELEVGPFPGVANWPSW